MREELQRGMMKGRAGDEGRELSRGSWRRDRGGS